MNSKSKLLLTEISDKLFTCLNQEVALGKKFFELEDIFINFKINKNGISNNNLASFILYRHGATPFRSTKEIEDWLMLPAVSLKIRHLGDAAEKIVDSNKILKEQIAATHKSITDKKQQNPNYFKAQNLQEFIYERWKLAIQPNSSTMQHSFFFTRFISQSLWNQGEEYCQKLVSSNTKLTTAHIKIMYNLIGLTHGITFRKNKIFHREDQEIYSNLSQGKEYISPKLVDMEMDYFVNWVNKKISACQAGKYSPLVLATVAGIWFVSIHPFDNSNGRVRHLIEKYILDICGYPMKHAHNLPFTSCIFPQEEKSVRHDTQSPAPFYKSEITAALKQMIEGVNKAIEFFEQSTKESKNEEKWWDCFSFAKP